MDADGVRLAHLDLIRGAAALAVCADHLRAFFMVDWPQASHGWPNFVFYLATAYGHQAVMIFFVLSGFFIAGSVTAAYMKGAWSWPKYAVARLTRLWSVLLPALLATALLDNAGLRLGSGAGYDGTLMPLISGIGGPGAPASLDLKTFFGNLFFLQTVAVPHFGTNAPLWSLANEFWYYVLFPLGLIGVLGRGWSRWLHAALFCLLAALLPRDLLRLGIPWLFGYGSWWLLRRADKFPLVLKGRWLAAWLVLLAAALLGSRRSLWQGWDMLIGFAFAMAVPALAARRPASRLYAALATAVSEISYTAYCSHFPLLAFIWFVFLAPGQFQPDLSGYAAYAAVFLLMLAYVFAMWWLFERNTGAVRRWCYGKLNLFNTGMAAKAKG